MSLIAAWQIPCRSFSIDSIPMIGMQPGQFEKVLHGLGLQQQGAQMNPTILFPQSLVRALEALSLGKGGLITSPHSNLFDPRRHLPGTFLFALLLCCCLSNGVELLGLAPQRAERKCSDGKDNDADGAIDCADSDCSSDAACGGGGEEPINFPSALNVQWTGSAGGNQILEDAPRPCTLASSSATYASFHCWHVEAPSVFYALETGVQTARKGDPSYCGTFVGGLWINPNSSYQIDWDCRSLPCTVRVLNWAYGDEVSSKIPGAGALQVEGFADASPGWPSTLSPDAVEITFRGEGTNKTVSKCLWNSSLGNIQFSQIVP